ncbi:amidohydrolase family protein [Gordonia sp. HNM0687]|uniref:Amidohydrolase family protein n=1 Tax=Gordonia mangrovi TaxID=2665643 RepID=A0A6L7GMI2_9ACTN|nr:amidohydrolase family protein [Gordonia mangrovi]MXP20401.1 amidohydrolase family protein [Gordonia mangrovi]UVF80597.1 amidohydrolase [Gordonia mangrovi]
MYDTTRPTSFGPEEADAVRQVWQTLGLPGLIDIHTHFMPKPVMDKVWAYFDSAGPLIGREWPITYRADEDVRVAALQRFGIRGYSSLVYPHKPNMAEWLNGWAADFGTHHPDCLRTATFYPEESAPTYVSRAIQHGTQVFKCHIQVGDFSPMDSLLDGVWSQIADSQVPVIIHCGSGPAPGAYTGPEPIAALLHRFPSLPLIIAHMGTPEYVEFLDLAERYPNVRFDTTMSFTDFAEEDAPFPKDALPRLVDLGDRIMFGSDYPNIPYPYTHALEAVVRLDLGDEWLRDVLYRNAAQLFSIAP